MDTDEMRLKRESNTMNLSEYLQNSSRSLMEKNSKRKHSDVQAKGQERLIKVEEENRSNSLSPIRRSPELFFEDDEVHLELESSSRSGTMSTQGKWNPTELMTKCCFDSTNGTILSEDLCLENLAKAEKSKKGVNFYDTLHLSQLEGIKGSPFESTIISLSYVLFKLNKLDGKKKVDVDRSLDVEDQSYIIQRFDLAEAREVDRPSMLPGGKSIQLTRLITNSLVSNWIGKPIERAMEIAILEILVEVKKRDPCFLLYSAAQSYKTKYPRIEDRFFENFATVLHAGFGLGNGTEPNDWEYQKTIFMMKDITQKFLDRSRGKRTAEFHSEVSKFKHLLKINKLFRARELGIQDEEMHTDTGVQEDEGPSVTEPNMDDI